ncbi:MAG: BON domain-containing protein [Rhodanobacter sp.]
MRSNHLFRQSLIAAGLVAAFTAMPITQAVAQDATQQTPVAAQNAQMQPPPQSSSNETVPGKVDDTWITTKVKSEFVAAKHVKASDITVNTTDGVVTLSGTASSAQEKKDAVRIAKKVKGVKSVDASGLTSSTASNQ